MDQEVRFSGHWICGQQGTGKTNLLLHMLASDLQKDASIIILDSKGELTGAVRTLALGERLVVLDPQQPFAINPLDVPKTDISRAVDRLEYIFGALFEAPPTPKQKALLRSILRAVVTSFPDPTLQTIQDIITRGPAAYARYIQQLPADLQEFFNNEWRDYDATRGELKWRIRLVLENDLIRRMFGAPRTRFNLSKMVNGDSHVIVIDNAIEKLGEGGSAFLGRYFLAQVWAAATARQSIPPDKRRPVFIYVDEASIILDSTVATIIDFCRSANIALILAHQRTKQIKDPNVLSALENCAIKMANVDAEASYFSDLLHIPEEKINQLPRGHFATHIRGEGSSIVTVPRAELPYRNMTDAEQRAHRQRMVDLYGYTSTQTAPEGAVSFSPSRGGKAEAKMSAADIPARTEMSASADKQIIPKNISDPSAPARWRKG